MRLVENYRYVPATGRTILDLYLDDQRRLDRLPEPIAKFILLRSPEKGSRLSHSALDPLIDKPMFVRSADPDPERVSVLGLDILLTVGTDPDTPVEVMLEWLDILKARPFENRIVFHHADGVLLPVNAELLN